MFARRASSALLSVCALAGCASSFAPEPLPWTGGVDLEDARVSLIEGAEPLGNAGRALAVVRREGRTWLAIGAPFHRGRGAVHVVDAEAPPARLSGDVPTWVGEAGGDAAGSAVAAVGDLDGDGREDLAVGAWRRDPRRGEDGGAVYVLFDPARGGALEAAPLVIEGGPGDAAGFAIVEGPVDLSGDGAPDLVFSAFHADGPDGESAGGVFVFHGPLAPGRRALEDADHVIWGEPGDHAGLAVARAYDVDGDGHEDLWVGAPQRAASDPARRGVACLERGPFAPGSRRLGGGGPCRGAPSPGAGFGSRLLGLDGGRAALVLDPADPTQARAAALLRLSNARGDGLFAGEPTRLVGAAPDDALGRALRALSDLDGDGAEEVAVAASGPDGRGRVVLVSPARFDGAGLETQPAFLTGGAADDELGADVAVLGDVNGALRLAIGAPGHDTDALHVGAVHLVELGGGTR